MIENAISNSSIAGRPPNSDFLIGFWPGENLQFFQFSPARVIFFDVTENWAIRLRSARKFGRMEISMRRFRI